MLMRKENAYEALENAKKGNFSETGKLLDQADQALSKAHEAQTDALCQEANGENSIPTLLTVHCQDHLMTSMSEISLVKELIELYRSREIKKGDE